MSYAEKEKLPLTGVELLRHIFSTYPLFGQSTKYEIPALQRTII